jgi:hypothetical protein
MVDHNPIQFQQHQISQLLAHNEINPAALADETGAHNLKLSPLARPRLELELDPLAAQTSNDVTGTASRERIVMVALAERRVLPKCTIFVVAIVQLLPETLLKAVF